MNTVFNSQEQDGQIGLIHNLSPTFWICDKSQHLSPCCCHHLLLCARLRMPCGSSDNYFRIQDLHSAKTSIDLAKYYYQPPIKKIKNNNTRAVNISEINVV